MAHKNTEDITEDQLIADLTCIPAKKSFLNCSEMNTIAYAISICGDSCPSVFVQPDTLAFIYLNTVEIQCASVFNVSLSTFPLFKTAEQFWDDFENNITALNYSQSEAIESAYYAYDAVWLAALALHNASVELENGAVEGRSGLSNFTYADSEINNLILRAAYGVNFRGVSVSGYQFLFLLYELGVVGVKSTC